MVEADSFLCNQIWAKVYEANCISRQLGRCWAAAALVTGPPLWISVDRLFYSDIAVQFLIRKLLCFSTRNQSPSCWCPPYLSQDMPKVICSTKWVLFVLTRVLYYCSCVHACMVRKSFLLQLYIRMEFVSLHFHNQYPVVKILAHVSSWDIFFWCSYVLMNYRNQQELKGVDSGIQTKKADQTVH